MERSSILERVFKLSERQTTPKQEILAGLTTFMTVSYMVIVNPLILSDAGIPKEAALAATIYAIVFSTILMALWANFPIVTGPGMGLNAFFTYSVVLGQGLSWQTALGAVFISGILFFLLTVTGIRSKIVDAIPNVLKASIAVGIGLFVAFIGLKNAGLVVANESTFVGVGNVLDKGPLLTIFGLILAAVLMAKHVKGALIISIFATTAVAMVVGFQAPPTAISDVFSATPPTIGDTFMQMDLKGAIAYGIFSVVFSFTIVELFDTLATLIGLSKKANLVDENGKIPNLNRALAADSVGTMASAIFGSTALNTYIENATGIAEGGRTGLKALTVAVLFLCTLFFAPLIDFIPSVATAPALIIIGSLMLSDIKNVNFDDFTEVVPAFLTIIMMPLTYSIAEGLAFGFISYTAIKLFTGRYREIHWMMYIITIAFFINFYMMSH
ncbi:NCS2 family permease [Priestia flexa]|uniref:Guanine permease n=2 Tax=Priestia TaxID=2800373 RepID=A0A0V8JNQ5_9BACI|nr:MULTISPECIES: NCS2 family permease [Bacillaceae]AQX55661.1 guanine permease [Priestia flexa]KSU88687.1 guanine permease [Priestia veravalensis]KZB90124.1 guanine permease [Bacillus sp. VT 712]MBN8250960.1 NCS2 family permease [Priestia flexa]MBN8433178.1 NCS2 family permease [Priestia flexa]